MIVTINKNKTSYNNNCNNNNNYITIFLWKKKLVNLCKSVYYKAGPKYWPNHGLTCPSSPKPVSVLCKKL